MKPTTPAEKFMARIAVQPNGCWHWKGARGSRHRSGIANWQGEVTSARRVAWAIQNGDLPDFPLASRCRDFACSNPAHVRLSRAAEHGPTFLAAWRDGETQAAIAERTGFDRSAVNRAIHKTLWAQGPGRRAGA